jgi:hypothetical protein
MLREQAVAGRPPGIEGGQPVGVADPAAPVGEVELVLERHGIEYRGDQPAMSRAMTRDKVTLVHVLAEDGIAD